IICGTTGLPGPTPSDAWMVKTNGLGQVEWENNFGGIDSDGSFSIVACTDGGYALCGMTNSFGPYPEVYLVKTDANGSIVSVPEINGANQRIVSVWPNPFSDQINIRFSGQITEDISLKVFDPNGRLIWQEITNSNNDLINLNTDLPSGLYFLHIHSRDTSQTIKLIKQP